MLDTDARCESFVPTLCRSDGHPGRAQRIEDANNLKLSFEDPIENQVVGKSVDSPDPQVLGLAGFEWTDGSCERSFGEKLVSDLSGFEQPHRRVKAISRDELGLPTKVILGKRLNPNGPFHRFLATDSLSCCFSHSQ